MAIIWQDHECRSPEYNELSFNRQCNKTEITWKARPTRDGHFTYLSSRGLSWVLFYYHCFAGEFNQLLN